MDNQSTVGMCHGKHAFASWREAKASTKAKREVSRLRGKDLPVMVVYHCQTCGSFHVAGKG